VTHPIDFKRQHAAGKLSAADTAEVQSVTPEKLDGVLWVDRVRVCKVSRGRYVLLDSKTGETLGRFDLIDEALREAQRYNRERWG